MHEAKWFGLSLLLHLAIASSLYFGVSSNVEHVSKTIVVVLDNPALPEVDSRKVSYSPVRAEVRPEKPVSKVPVIIKQQQPLPGPQLLPEAIKKQLPEPDRAIKSSAGLPEKSAAVVRKTASISPVAVTAKVAEIPEIQQRQYLKEHFNYIRDLIGKRLVYPSMARRMHWQGKTVVAFVIKQDGSVHSLRVVKTSGFALLDRCAIETVRDAAPFPRPPVQAEIVLPVSFNLVQ